MLRNSSRPSSTAVGAVSQVDRAGPAGLLPASTWGGGSGECDGTGEFRALVTEPIPAKTVTVWASLWWDDWFGGFGFASNQDLLQQRASR